MFEMLMKTLNSHSMLSTVKMTRLQQMIGGWVCVSMCMHHYVQCVCVRVCVCVSVCVYMNVCAVFVCMCVLEGTAYERLVA